MYEDHTGIPQLINVNTSLPLLMITLELHGHIYYQVNIMYSQLFKSFMHMSKHNFKQQ